MVDPSYPNDDFQGVQVSLPIGAWGIGFDAHLATANTETILKKNLNELFNGFVGE